MDGYMIEVEYDEQTICVHAKNKAARGALTGWESTIVTTDEGKYRVQTRAGENDIEIPRATITAAMFKSASMMSNGKLVVSTADGKFQLHFRKKQQAGFEELARSLGATG